MLLECYNQAVPHGILVNVEAGFEDVLTLGRFVEKLPSVVGYQQVRFDDDNLSAFMPHVVRNTRMKLTREPMTQHGSKPMNRDRPILMFVEDTNHPLTFFFPGDGAAYFEITHTPSDTQYRFAYIAGVNRMYEAHPEDFDRPGKNRYTYLMHNSPPNPNDVPRVFELRRRVVVSGPFVNLAEVDVSSKN
ncbi:unnamed protein product, partial [Mesorhabditis belari]|uniref:Uncharacterized protein n=1 Tax=Mesorhabditis belari TaxID=2138241 RepID=A0AAF3FG72_9BILA